MIIVSCYFGWKITGIYPAPLPDNCFFFSNNNALKDAAEQNGWSFVFVENMPLSAEPRIASLQSKYVKFLQFDKNSVDWKNGDSILYFGHKFKIKSKHIEYVQSHVKSALLIRNTPRKKLAIQDEVNEALRQKRYSEVMAETVAWVDQKIKNDNLSPLNRIMNTELILYADPKKTQQLCDEVYKTCWLLGQPECQIIWGLLAQPYENLITRIEWHDLDVLRKELQPPTGIVN